MAAAQATSLLPALDSIVVNVRRGPSPNLPNPMPERSTPVPLTHLSITAGARVKERLAQAARSPEALAEHVRGQLIDLLQLQGCRFEYGRLIGHPPRLEQNGDVVVGRRHWNVERHGWPDGEIELRATANGRYLGRFMLLGPPRCRSATAGTARGGDARRPGPGGPRHGGTAPGRMTPRDDA